MSKENLEKFTNEFCVAKSATTSNGPREVTILKDIDGNQLGRKCTVTEKWFANDAFSKGTTCVKLADAERAKLYTESKKMERDAQKLLDEAKEITDVEEKVAKYEEYDKALADAKAFRTTPVTITDEMLVGGFDTIEDLAASMGVEVNPVKPTPVENAEGETTQEEE